MPALRARPLAAVVLCAATLAPAIAAADGAPPLIVVTGAGEVSVAPNRARLSLRVQRTAGTAALAGGACARATQAVTAALAAAGLATADLKSTRTTVSPRWDYAGGRRQRAGFDATSTLSIETHRLEQLGAYIDAALGAGVTDVEDPDFDVEDAEGARQEALARAAAAARRDAETLARAAGGTLGELILMSTATEGGADGGVAPLTMVARAMAPPPPPPTAVLPGELTIRAQVSARWAFVPARR